MTPSRARGRPRSEERRDAVLNLKAAMELMQEDDRSNAAWARDTSGHALVVGMRLTTSMRAARAGWPRHARTTVHSHRSARYTPPPPDAAGNPRHSVITAKQRCGSTIAVPPNWFGWRVMPCTASPGSSPHSIPAVSAFPDRWTTNSSASPAIRPTYKAGSRRHSYCRAGTIRFNT